MSYAYVIIPIGRRNNMTAYCQSNNINFEPHLWRKGIPDPAINDWNQAVECSKESAPSENPTHLILWGEFDAQQSTDLDNNNIQGTKIYYASDGWDRRSALREEDLKQHPTPLEEWENSPSTQAFSDSERFTAVERVGERKPKPIKARLDSVTIAPEQKIPWYKRLWLKIKGWFV